MTVRTKPNKQRELRHWTLRGPGGILLLVSLLLVGFFESTSWLQEPAAPESPGASAASSPVTPLLGTGGQDPDATASAEAGGDEAEGPPADFAENVQRFEEIQVQAGIEGYTIELTLHRWGPPSVQSRGFQLEVAQKPDFIAAVRWPEGDSVEFGQDEIEKELVLEFDTEEKTRSKPDGELHILIKAQDGEVQPPQRLFKIPLRTEILEDNLVVAYPLKEDAPEEFPHEETIDYCDTEQTTLLLYDRVGLFFTPARDFQPPLTDKHFYYSVHNPDGETSFTFIEPGDHNVMFQEGEDGKVTPSFPYAKQGSPGMFAVTVSLWADDNRGGTFSVKTTKGVINTGLLGAGPLFLEAAPGAKPQTEGTFEVSDARLHYQGFVMEEARDRSLDKDRAVMEGSLTVTQEGEGGQVVLSGAAQWFLAEEKDGKRVPGPDLFKLQGSATLSFPSVLDPGAYTMGELSVDARPATGSGTKARGREGDEISRVFEYVVRELVPTNKLPPDRYLVKAEKGGKIPKGWGGIQKKGTKSIFNRGWYEHRVQPGAETRVTVDLELKSSERHSKAGVPERGLPWHLRDEGVIWVLPVAMNYSYPNRDSFTGSPYVSVYGYAVYGAKEGKYAGPLPQDPEDGGRGEEGGAQEDGQEDGTADGTAAGAADGGAGDAASSAGGAAAGTPAAGSGDAGADPIDPAQLRGPERDALIGQWLGVAEPPPNALHGARLKYNEWGVMVGSTPSGIITGTPGKPDEAAGMQSPDYIWSKREVLDSVDHCTVGEWVMARIQESSTDHCRGRYRRIQDGDLGVDSGAGQIPPERDSGGGLSGDDVAALTSGAGDDTAADADTNETDAQYGSLPGSGDVADTVAAEGASQSALNGNNEGLDAPYDGPQAGADDAYLAAQGVDPTAGIRTQAVDAPSQGDLALPASAAAGPDNSFEGQRSAANNAVQALVQVQQGAAQQESAAADNLIKNTPIPTRGNMSGITVRGTNRVTLSVWDHGSEDGDRVRIVVGGRTLSANLTLRKQKQSFTIDLPSRFTSISVLAHNEGSSSPNTASLEVTAGGRVLGRSQWGLKTHDLGSTLIRRDD